MAAEMMSGDLPVTSDADAMAKQRAKEAELAGGGTMLASGGTKRRADQVCVACGGRREAWRLLLILTLAFI